MKVRYTGNFPADLPLLGIHVEPGDVLEVPDGLRGHPHFEEIHDAPKGRARAASATDPSDPSKEVEA